MTMKKMKKNEFDTFLESALRRHANAPQDNDAAAARVLKRLAGPLPRQKRPFWRLPAELLDWQFAPAWPRMATLGACLALGFVIGIAGLDRRIDGLDGSTGGEVGLLVFEAEPPIGVR
jgi:hypothetical protein